MRRVALERHQVALVLAVDICAAIAPQSLVATNEILILVVREELDHTIADGSWEPLYTSASPRVPANS